MMNRPNGIANDASSSDFHDSQITRYLMDQVYVQGAVRECSVIDTPDHVWEKQQYRLNAVMAYLRAKKNESVGDVAKGLGISPSTLYTWIHKYFEGSGDGAYLLDQRRRPGRRLHPEVMKIIILRIHTDFLQGQRISISALTVIIQDDCIERNLPPPHRNTVSGYVKKIPPSILALERLGPRTARVQFKATGCGYDEAKGPLDIVQIDCTPVDVILLDPESRRAVGRAHITAAVDVYSRMLVGYCLSYDKPKYLTTGLCLIHAVLPKEPWLLKHGLDFSWPCKGLPMAIHSDSGKEFANKDFVRVCERYSIGIHRRRLKVSEDGGIIESFIKTMNQKVHNIPGTTFSNPKERGEYKSEKMAILTLDELNLILLNFFVGEYPNLPHSGLKGQTPLSKWKEGWVEDSTGLPRGNPRSVDDEGAFKIEFLPHDRRRLDRKGIRFGGYYYFCDQLRERINERDPKAARKYKKFRIHFDPRDLRFIYFYDPDCDEFILVPNTDRSLGPISLEESKELGKITRLRNRATEDRGTAARARRNMRSIVESSSRETKSARRERTRNTKNKKDNIHAQLEESGYVTLSPAEMTAPKGDVSHIGGGEPQLDDEWIDLVPYADIE